MATAEQTRDYFAEAQRIASGERAPGELPPMATREHVVAALEFADSLKKNVEQASKIVAAIIYDNLEPGKEPVMYVPQDMLDAVTKARVGVVFEHTARGVVARLMLPTPKRETH
jgi:hypothetical protein